MKLMKYFTVETYEKYRLEKRELLAIKNLISLARERLWLAESYPQRPDISIEHEEVISEEDIATSRESISIALGALQKYKQ